MRPLPPLAGGPRPHAGGRAQGVSLQRGLAADLPGRWRDAQPARPRLLRAAGRRAPRARHRAGRDAVPLGPAAGARDAARRLDRAGDRRTLRGLRSDRVRRAGRPRPAVGDPERAVGRGVRRATCPGAMPPVSPTSGRRSVPRTTCCSDTPERCRSSARWACAGRSGSRSISRWPRRTATRTRTGAPPSSATATRTAGSSTPCSTADTRRTSRPCSTTAARASATRWSPGTLLRSRPRSTSSA